MYEGRLRSWDQIGIVVIVIWEWYNIGNERNYEGFIIVGNK